ncbi:hypothetical protein AgCh_025725 [Apium graveolens]
MEILKSDMLDTDTLIENLGERISLSHLEKVEAVKIVHRKINDNDVREEIMYFFRDGRVKSFTLQQLLMKTVTELKYIHYLLRVENKVTRNWSSMILEVIRRRLMTKDDKYNGDYVPEYRTYTGQEMQMKKGAAMLQVFFNSPQLSFSPDHVDVSLSFMLIGDLEISKSSISKLRSAIYQLGEDTEKKRELKKKLVKVLRDKEEDRLKNFFGTTVSYLKIMNSSEVEHQKHLQLVLGKLVEHQLYANMKKCEFGKRVIVYLGHVISEHGVEVEQTKVQAMLDWKPPGNLKELRGFLGLTGYCRKFVADYAHIAHPLTELLKRISLRGIKSKLLGAQAQLKSIYEKELIDIYLAILKWKPYLLGRHFIVSSDQQSLRLLTQQREQNKASQRSPAGLLQPLPNPTHVWSDISMNFIEGLPLSSGIDTVLVMVDRLTKYTHFLGLKHPFDAFKVATLFIKEVVHLHGFPSYIIFDRDRIFLSKFWYELFKLHGTTLKKSTSYHPQIDGQSEIVNKGLETYLSPFNALYGRDPPHLVKVGTCQTVVGSIEKVLQERDAILDDLCFNLIKAQQVMKLEADLKRRDESFEADDLVYLKLQPCCRRSLARRPFGKLDARYYGLTVLLRVLGK